MSSEILKHKYGFIGGGNMAWAIFNRLLQLGVSASHVIVSAPSMRNLQRWKELGANITHNNGEPIISCSVIFLAIKPQIFLAEKKIWLTEDQVKIVEHSALFVSVIAGLTVKIVTEKLQKLCLFPAPNVIRVMPNTPLSVGTGCAVICETGDERSEFVKSIFSGNDSLAKIVPEHLIDAAAVLSGCGPAFFYQMLEAMADGGVHQGVPRDLALTLSAQTMIGAANMVLKTGKNPAQLKDEVCSPAGTTIAGLYALKSAPNFNAAVMDAIKAATIRSKELASGVSLD